MESTEEILTVGISSNIEMFSIEIYDLNLTISSPGTNSVFFRGI